MRTAGIALVIIGIVLLIFRTFSFTQQKKVVDIGPLEINKTEKKTIGWPIYAGGIAIVAGIIILAGAKKKD